ncbi:hypothetical protein [Acidithiobacillus sp. AMEEHan]|uniref:hypothetical protein n=1 Tax=Acidithiobacillus sp. AMEEHan TaxID=2994951 RepID=UPI0027E53496|nr:hypothetical protein [Acidithiobacillus sp. AMEEHan]
MHNVVAPLHLPKGANPADDINVAVQNSIHSAVIFVGSLFTEVFQYLFPVIFLLGGLVSFLRARKAPL